MRRNKFGAIATMCDGFKFPSKGEARRWLELKAMQMAGEITQLERQVVFKLTAHEVLICKYIADFTYFNRLGVKVVEDFKGKQTDVFKLKWKLLAAQLKDDIEAGRIQLLISR